MPRPTAPTPQPQPGPRHPPPQPPQPPRQPPQPPRQAEASVEAIRLTAKIAVSAMIVFRNMINTPVLNAKSLTISTAIFFGVSVGVNTAVRPNSRRLPQMETRVKGGS